MDDIREKQKCLEVYDVVAKLCIYLKELQDISIDFKKNAALEKSLEYLFSLDVHKDFEIPQFKKDLYTGLENLTSFLNNMNSFPPLNPDNGIQLLNIVNDIQNCQESLVQITAQQSRGVSDVAIK